MKIVVIGNGMVGHKFCEKLIAKILDIQFEIVVFGEEIRPAYDRVHFSEFFSSKSATDLSLTSAEWYIENNIQLHLVDPIKSIDREYKTVITHKGIIESYDYLILTTVPSPLVLPIPVAID